MKFAVMGAGAVGCYYGGRLAQSGADVAFIGRGAHLDAIKRDGLRIESPHGDVHIHPAVATDDPAEVGPVDMVLFLVKLYDTEEAARRMAPLLGPETAVASFQNGVDGWERIGKVVGPERVIGGTVVIPAEISAPGVMRHNGPLHKLTFGEFDGRLSARCRSMLDAFTRAGVDVALSRHIAHDIWEKFVFLSAFSAITALTRLPNGAILDDPPCRELLRRAVFEAFAVGKAVLPDLSDELGDRAVAHVEATPRTVRASMAQDLARGKRLELEHLSGAVVRLGREHGVPTPVHEVVLGALHPYAQGRAASAG